MGHTAEVKAECIRLRVEERLTLPQIQEKTSVARGTLSGWLKPYRLTDAELLRNRKPPTPNQKKEQGIESNLHKIVRSNHTSASHVGRISEAAVLLRLLSQGFSVFGSPFDGDVADWVVDVGGRLLRIQVKTAVRGAHGLATISLRRGHRSATTRYATGEFDILVGFDLFEDVAYVWTWDELLGRKATVTIHPDAKERWDKLK